MGVTHSMDEAQVNRISEALKGSANAIQGINAKFSIVEEHYKRVQTFNDKINAKVEGSLVACQRLDSTLHTRIETVLDTLEGATGEFTKALEGTLVALQRFDMRHEVNQLPKAFIPFMIPCILLLIELAVANAYLGILLASIPEVKERYAWCSTYLLGNASAVLFGLTLSLVWLGVYRVWLSFRRTHKSKHHSVDLGDPTGSLPISDFSSKLSQQSPPGSVDSSSNRRQSDDHPEFNVHSSEESMPRIQVSQAGPLRNVLEAGEDPSAATPCYPSISGDVSNNGSSSHLESSVSTPRGSRSGACGVVVAGRPALRRSRSEPSLSRLAVPKEGRHGEAPSFNSRLSGSDRSENGGDYTRQQSTGGDYPHRQQSTGGEVQARQQSTGGDYPHRQQSTGGTSTASHGQTIRRMDRDVATQRRRRELQRKRAAIASRMQGSRPPSPNGGTRPPSPSAPDCGPMADSRQSSKNPPSKDGSDITPSDHGRSQRTRSVVSSRALNLESHHREISPGSAASSSGAGASGSGRAGLQETSWNFLQMNVKWGGSRS